MFRYITIIIVIILLGFLIPQSVFARIVPCGQADAPDCQLCHIFILIRNIVMIIFEVIVPLAVLFIVIGGIMILTAAGSAERATKGKKAISYAVVGIIIALGAWIIVNSVIVVLVNPNIFPLPWNAYKLKCPVVKIDPSIAATTSYVLLNDADNSGDASPGDSLKYSLTYTNTSDTNLTNLIIISDYDQNHIFAIINISENGVDNGDKITWQIDSLNSNQSIIVSYNFILTTDFSDLLGANQRPDINLFAKIFDKISEFLTQQTLAKTQTIYFQNIITISSDQAETETLNDPMIVIVAAQNISDPEDIPNNPDYLAGYYEEPDDKSSKWPNYDWYFNQVSDNGGNVVRLAFYNSPNPFYSLSPWIDNDCSQPNQSFYTDWLRPTVDNANSQGIYVILTLYIGEWECDNKTQDNREKTYDRIIDFLHLPQNKVIIEIDWEAPVISIAWMQDQAKYFEDRNIPTMITNGLYDDNHGGRNSISTYAGRHRHWDRETSLDFFDIGKPTIWTERWFRYPGAKGEDSMTRFEARENIYRDALTVREPILFYYIRWSTPGEPDLPSEYLKDVGYAVELSKKIPWKEMVPQERYNKAVADKGYWAVKNKEALLGWVNKESQVVIDITGWNGEYNYWWYNPRNGKFNYIDTISGNPIRQILTISTPDSSEDWVFVLKGEGIARISQVCGDKECNGNETCLTCPIDCGTCPLPPISMPVSFSWTCNNKFSGYCYYVDRCSESVLWMQGNDDKYDEYVFTFDSASTGIYNCQVKVTTGAFLYLANRYQNNEKTDVYINNTYIGTSDDFYCNTGDGDNDCGSCEHVVTLLSKNNININLTNNEIKLVGHDSHGLIKLEINCSK